MASTNNSGMISVEHLKVEFSAKALFEDVSFVVNKRDRIALVGKNGAQNHSRYAATHRWASGCAA